MTHQQRIDLLLPFFNLIPTELREWTYIAGSSVADPMLATDIDMFILVGGDHNAYTVASDLREHFAKTGLSHLVVFTKPIDAFDMDEEARYPTHFEVIANIEGIGRKIQFIVFKADSVAELLGDFDINYTRFAISAGGRLWEGNGARTLTEGPPELLHVNRRDESVDRMKMFENRSELALVLAGYFKLHARPPIKLGVDTLDLDELPF